MRAGIVIASLFAAGAVATPLVERAYETEVVVHYETVVVTAGAEPTPTPSSYGSRPHRGHGKGKGKGKKHSIYQPPEYGNTRTEEQAPAKTQDSGSKSPSGGNTGSDPNDTSYSGRVLYHHNVHRANHSAADLEWDEGLASTALKIAQSCVYAHNTDQDGGGYGQNIAAGIAEDDIGECISDAFYNGEVGAYPGYGSEPDMGNFHVWGHFSQIVWKGTTKVGCATYDCSGSGLSGVSGNVPPTFTVCNYKDPGNFAGEYAQNVLQPRGDATVAGKRK